MRAYEDWLFDLDRPMIVTLPLVFFGALLPAVLVIVGVIAALLWLYGAVIGFPPLRDPHFYEDGCGAFGSTPSSVR